MTTGTDDYASLSKQLLEEGQQALSRGELVQASEKLWGAAAQMVKSVAEKRGWPHSSHRDLFQVASRLAQETSDPELRGLFQIANSLHTNFYENWLPMEVIQRGWAQVQEFVQRLERV